MNIQLGMGLAIQLLSRDRNTATRAKIELRKLIDLSRHPKEPSDGEPVSPFRCLRMGPQEQLKPGDRVVWYGPKNNTWRDGCVYTVVAEYGRAFRVTSRRFQTTYGGDRSYWARYSTNHFPEVVKPQKTKPNKAKTLAQVAKEFESWYRPCVSTPLTEAVRALLQRESRRTAK